MPTIACSTNTHLVALDRYYWRQWSGVEWVIKPPRKLGAVLGAANAWEKARVGPTASIVANTDATSGTYAYRMYYDVTPELYSPAHRREAYALSNDGITWVRPQLNQASYKALTTNNLFATADYPGAVMYDANASAYKMICNYGSSGTKVFTSANGRTSWTAPGGYQTTVFADGHNQVFWDAALSLYVCYFRGWSQLSPNKRGVVRFTQTAANIVGTWASLPATWARPAFGTVFDAGPSISESWLDIPSGNCDIYYSGVTPYGNANTWLAFASNYYWSSSSDGDGVTNIHLATSRDGVTWQWADGDGRTTPYIPIGESHEPDHGTIYSAQGYINDGERILTYYGADNLSHGGGSGDGVASPYRSSIMATEQRIDGFMALKFGWPGDAWSHPLTYSGTVLEVNANASRGQLRVAVCDADGAEVSGYGLMDCTPITTDSTSQAVTWTGGSIGAISQPISLRFYGHNCEVFAWRFYTP